jgi:class 3 adenylate cyclase
MRAGSGKGRGRRAATSEKGCFCRFSGVDPTANALPTGVVTFLLTDIEGSTRLWEREHDAMRQALARHDALVTACIRRQNGHVVKSKGEGDSVFAVFRHVRDAVTAALVLQCALGVERWPTSAPIRVRMAIHTGQIDLREGDYYGPTVNRCARLRALATGGQVLLSGVTAKLTQGQLPAGGSLNDLGTHQLKDISAPERVWQLTHPQMPASVVAAVESRIAAPAAPSRRAYKLTDHLNQSADGREWGSGVKHTSGGLGDDSEDGLIRCYTSPKLAGLLNAIYERHRLPRLWEATVDEEPGPGDALVLCREVTTLRQVALPTPTGVQQTRFAVACARVAYEGGVHALEFEAWAEGWLAGQDSAGTHAREIADDLEHEARHGNAKEMMAANAARAAMHAARLSWLAGRAREEENSRAIELTTEVLHTAMRITRLDLPALADQAVPETATAVPTTRMTSPPPANRILRPLPT